MENNQQTGNAKKKNTHFIAAMAILGVAIAAAAIIAVITLVSGMGKTLSVDGTKLGDKDANTLYSEIKASVESEDNYTVTLTKTGGYSIIGNEVNITVDIITDIISKVDGDNFYYKSVTTTEYARSKDSEKTVTTVSNEISIVDGIAYIKTGDELRRHEVASDDYKKDFDAFKLIIWESAGLFNGAKFEENDGSYGVKLTATPKALTATLFSDILELFSNQYGALLTPFIPPVFSDVSYSIVFDGDVRPTEIKHGYDIKDAGNVLSGEVYMASDISYGGASVTLPDNAGDYVTVEPENK